MSDFPEGCHLIVVDGNKTTYRYRIIPEFAPLIAAGIYAENFLSNAIMTASDLRPSKNSLTKSQIAAWETLSKEFGEEIHVLEWPSARESSEKVIELLIAESEKFMYNPTVRKAYENFMTTVRLSYQGDQNDHN